MRTFSRSIAVLTASFLLATTATAGDRADGWYVANARNEIRDCMQDVRTPGWRFEADVTDVGVCKGGGSWHIVDFWQVTPPGQSVKPMQQWVATVEFDCDDTIFYATCAP